MNFANNLMSAAAPIITGYIVGASSSFAAAFFWRRRDPRHWHHRFRLYPWQDRTDTRSAPSHAPAIA
jgi:hypothetical protein